jgi:hypothetical protein
VQSTERCQRAATNEANARLDLQVTSTRVLSTGHRPCATLLARGTLGFTLCLTLSPGATLSSPPKAFFAKPERSCYRHLQPWTLQLLLSDCFSPCRPSCLACYACCPGQLVELASTVSCSVHPCLTYCSRPRLANEHAAMKAPVNCAEHGTRTFAHLLEDERTQRPEGNPSEVVDASATERAKPLPGNVLGRFNTSQFAFPNVLDTPRMRCDA